MLFENCFSVLPKKVDCFTFSLVLIPRRVVSELQPLNVVIRISSFENHRPSEFGFPHCMPDSNFKVM
jgi:hypothetical protein